MLYYCLKIIHIIAATLLLTSMGYSVHVWMNIQGTRDGMIRSQAIQALTWQAIIPLALLQLITGVGMISANEETWSAAWINISMMGFIIVIASWVSFIYFVIASQQIRSDGKSLLHRYHRLQKWALTICASTLLVMIFCMTNKVGAS